MRSRAGSNRTGVSSLTAPRWKTVPSTEAAVTMAHSSDGKPSRRAASSALIVEGTGRSERSDEATHASSVRVSSSSSTSIATISSAKRALPSAASAIRASAAGGTGAPSSRLEISCRLSASVSGSSRIEVALSLPPPQPGRVSSSSGRAMQRSRIGTSREKTATCSTRSRNVGSRPVDVVEHDHERPAAGERLEELPDRPEGLLARSSTRAAESHRLGDALGDQLRLRLSRDSRRDRRRLLAGALASRARDILDDLGQRPVA